MSRNSLNQFNLSFMKSTKNYEVKAVITSKDENGKDIKKTEQYLVLGAVSCADAEYIVMTEKTQLGGFETIIVSSKESNLVLLTQDNESAVNDFFYKVILLFAVEGSGDKPKFERISHLIEASRVKEAITFIENECPYDEIIAVSRSKIVEVIEAKKVINE